MDIVIQSILVLLFAFCPVLWIFWKAIRILLAPRTSVLEMSAQLRREAIEQLDAKFDELDRKRAVRAAQRRLAGAAPMAMRRSDVDDDIGKPTPGNFEDPFMDRGTNMLDVCYHTMPGGEYD